jgi:hypothetical protein
MINTTDQITRHRPTIEFTAMLAQGKLGDWMPDSLRDNANLLDFCRQQQLSRIFCVFRLRQCII